MCVPETLFVSICVVWYLQFVSISVNLCQFVSICVNVCQCFVSICVNCVNLCQFVSICVNLSKFLSQAHEHFSALILRNDAKSPSDNYNLSSHKHVCNCMSLRAHASDSWHNIGHASGPTDPIRFLNPNPKNPSSAAWLGKKVVASQGCRL